MGCIDKKLTPEQVEERAILYVIEKMDFEDEAAFVEHMLDCEYCDAKVSEINDLHVGFKLMKLEKEVEEHFSNKSLTNSKFDAEHLRIAIRVQKFAIKYNLHKLMKQISPKMEQILYWNHQRVTAMVLENSKMKDGPSEIKLDDEDITITSDPTSTKQEEDKKI